MTVWNKLYRPSHAYHQWYACHNENQWDRKWENALLILNVLFVSCIKISQVGLPWMLWIVFQFASHCQPISVWVVIIELLPGYVTPVQQQHHLLICSDFFGGKGSVSTKKYCGVEMKRYRWGKWEGRDGENDKGKTGVWQVYERDGERRRRRGRKDIRDEMSELGKWWESDFFKRKRHGLAFS